MLYSQYQTSGIEKLNDLQVCIRGKVTQLSMNPKLTKLQFEKRPSSKLLQILIESFAQQKTMERDS